MKKIVKICLFIFCAATKTLAQPTGPQGDANYTFPQLNGPVINGVPTPVTTDPRNTNWPSPAYSPDFKRNYFPWFSETAPNTNLNPAYEYKLYGYDGIDLVPGQLYAEKISPFSPDNATDYTNPLRFRVPLSEAITTSPDYLPEDGWELVKQDMGYFKNDNSGLPKQRTIVSEPGVSELHNNPRVLPYLMLYNKFTGNLRILGYAGHIFNETPVGRISVVLSLNDEISNSTKNFSGLLNSYGETYNPLDQETKIQRAESMTAHQGIAGFFWADFQMSYDPCVCFYESWVRVDFRKLDSYDLKAYGQSISLDEGADPSEIASFLAAVWREGSENADPVKNGMFNYKSGRNLEAELVRSINASANYIKKDKMIKYAKLLGEAMAAIGEGVAEKAKGTKYELLAKGLKYGGKGISFFAASFESPISKATKTAIALSGTVSQSSLSGITKADIATPGSWNVKNRTGEFQPDPEYPVYNETLGTIAFLTTPTVKYYEFFKELDCDGICPVCWVSNGGKKKMGYSLDPSSLKFKINPIMDIKSYDIEVSIDFEFYFRPEGVEGIKFFNAEPYTYSGIYENGLKRALSGIFTPLNCVSGMASGVIVENFKDCYSQFYGYYDAQLMNPVVKILFKYTSNKKDRNGVAISGVQLFSIKAKSVMHTFPENNEQLSIFTNPEPFDERGMIPFELEVKDKLFWINDRYDRISAHEKMTFNGTLTNFQIDNGQKKMISFVSGEELEFLPGFETSGFSPMEFSIGSVILQNCSPSNNFTEVSNGFVTDFCKRSNPTVKYAANQGVPRLAVDNSNVLPPIVSNTKMGYPIPNPTTGTCAIGFDLAESGSFEMYMSNALGLRVKDLQRSDFAKAGNYTVQFNTENLEAGVYFITLTANGFRQARKLVVVK